MCQALRRAFCGGVRELTDVATCAFAVALLVGGCAAGCWWAGEAGGGGVTCIKSTKGGNASDRPLRWLRLKQCGTVQRGARRWATAAVALAGIRADVSMGSCTPKLVPAPRSLLGSCSALRH